MQIHKHLIRNVVAVITLSFASCGLIDTSRESYKGITISSDVPDSTIIESMEFPQINVKITPITDTVFGYGFNLLNGYDTTVVILTMNGKKYSLGFAYNRLVQYDNYNKKYHVAFSNVNLYYHDFNSAELRGPSNGSSYTLKILKK